MNSVKNIIFGVDSGLSHMLIKDIPVFGEEPTDGLDDTTITLEAKYSANITQSRKKICLCLHYITTMFFLYANGVNPSVQSNIL